MKKCKRMLMKQSFFQQTPVKIECSLLQMWKVPKLATLQTVPGYYKSIQVPCSVV